MNLILFWITYLRLSIDIFLLIFSALYVWLWVVIKFGMVHA